MTLQIVLEPSDEGGFTASVPSLPGCISEGCNRDEALKNIHEASTCTSNPQLPDMSSIAQDLDETLRRIDSEAAQRVERLVREILVLAEAPTAKERIAASWLELADHAEPMGVLSNAEIDHAIHRG